MLQQSFDHDRNYIVKQMQQDMQLDLSNLAIQRAVDNYLAYENPMGLIDDFVLQLQNIKQFNTDFLKEFYFTAASLFRFLYIDNQLEFVWDGRSQYEKYQDDWSNTFLSWIDKFHNTRSFSKIILKGAVLHQDQRTEFLQNSLIRILLSEFKVKRSTKGTIIKAKAA
ncbi:MAG: hypothetical protein JXQ90_10550 [Cyclobacteriaceae bacterium]